MSRSKARRAVWTLLHPLRAHRLAAAKRNWWRYPPRPPANYRFAEHFAPGQIPDAERLPGIPYELPPVTAGGFHDTILAFAEARWAGKCRHVGPAGYMCTDSTYDGPHDAHRSMAPSGEVFDVWTSPEPLLDECDVEALHLAADLCFAHYTPPGGHAYTCTLTEGHGGPEHISEGPDGEVWAKWPI